MIRLDLSESDVDIIIELLKRKIEKVSKKEVDEQMVQYLNQLEDLLKEIEVQISS